MFGKNKQPRPTVDITQKIVKTWWGGTKVMPATESEQRKMKKTVLEKLPDAEIVDSKAKQEDELEWIDRIEGFDAIWED